jgi:methylated-DNA-protein-cysteine methyltransferase-like protein
VINAQGRSSMGKLTIPVNLQQELLEAEGVEFDASGKCDLRKFQWFPEGRQPEQDGQTSLFEGD